MRILGPEAAGAVPIVVIAAFPRMAMLTEDLKRVVRVMRTMDVLCVSEDGATVRRTTPLIDFGFDSSTC